MNVMNALKLCDEVSNNHDLEHLSVVLHRMNWYQASNAAPQNQLFLCTYVHTIHSMFLVCV